MNLLELIDDKKTKQNELRDLVAKAEKEERKLNDDENQKYGELRAEIKQIEKDIEGLSNKEGEERSANFYVNTSQTKEKNKFNLNKTLRNYINGQRQDEYTAKVIGDASQRFLESGTAVNGGLQLPVSWDSEKRTLSAANSDEIISEEKQEIVMPLRENLVALKAGARLITGIKGDYNQPNYDGTSSDWVSEISGATDGSGTFGESTVKPLRLSTYLPVSRQLLLQDSLSAQQELLRDIYNSILAKLETTIWGKHSADSTKPNGFYTGLATSAYTVTSGVTYGKIIDLETSIDTANALQGKLNYIVHPTLKGILKQTNRGEYVADPVLAGNEMNGYNVFSTSAMPNELGTSNNEYGIIFGNFDDYKIISWSNGMDISIDDKSVAMTRHGLVGIVVNSYWNFIKRRADSFAIGSLKNV